MMNKPEDEEKEKLNKVKISVGADPLGAAIKKEK